MSDENRTPTAPDVNAEQSSQSGDGQTCLSLAAWVQPTLGTDGREAMSPLQELLSKPEFRRLFVRMVLQLLEDAKALKTLEKNAPSNGMLLVVLAAALALCGDDNVCEPTLKEVSEVAQVAKKTAGNALQALGTIHYLTHEILGNRDGVRITFNPSGTS